jgi:hypothetical protein
VGKSALSVAMCSGKFQVANQLVEFMQRAEELPASTLAIAPALDELSPDVSVNQTVVIANAMQHLQEHFPLFQVTN